MSLEFRTATCWEKKNELFYFLKSRYGVHGGVTVDSLVSGHPRDGTGRDGTGDGRFREFLHSAFDWELAHALGIDKDGRFKDHLLEWSLTETQLYS